jgi:hypothetical protein
VLQSAHRLSVSAAQARQDEQAEISSSEIARPIARIADATGLSVSLCTRVWLFTSFGLPAASSSPLVESNSMLPRDERVRRRSNAQRRCVVETAASACQPALEIRSTQAAARACGGGASLQPSSEVRR